MLAESTRRQLSALVVAVTTGAAIYVVERKDHQRFPIALDEPITTWKMGTCEAVADRNQPAAPWKRCDDHPECWELDAHIINTSLGSPVARVDHGTPSIALTVTPWTDFSEPIEMLVRGDRRSLLLTPTTCLWMWEAAKPWRAFALSDRAYEIVEGSDGAPIPTELTEIGDARFDRHAEDTGCYVHDNELVRSDGTSRRLDLPPPDDGAWYQVLANDCNAAVMLEVSESRGSSAYTRIDGLFYVRPELR